MRLVLGFLKAVTSGLGKCSRTHRDVMCENCLRGSRVCGVVSVAIVQQIAKHVAKTLLGLFLGCCGAFGTPLRFLFKRV